MNDTLKKAIEKASDIMNVDKVKVVEAMENSYKQSQEMRTNAQSDIMNTSNPGFGKESTVPVEYTDELYSMVGRLPGLLSKLPGNHGQVNASTLKPDVIGELGLFDHVDEPTGSQTYSNLTTEDGINTDELEIKIKSFRRIFGISKKALFTARGGANNFWNVIQNRILLGMNKTIEAYIINADPTLADNPENSANVNFYDVDGTETMNPKSYWLSGNDGIRKIGIDNGIIGGNVAFGRNIFLELLGELSDYADDASNLLFIQSGRVANMTRGLTEYSTQDKYKDPTNTNGGFVMYPEGIEAYTTPVVRKQSLMPSLVGESGKIEVSAGANNDFRTMSLLYKYAPQYAFGRDVDVVVKEDSQMLLFDVSFDFGVDFTNNKAEFGKTVATAVFKK